MTKYQIQQTKQSVLYMCRLTFKTLALVIGVGYGLLYAFLHIPAADAATLKAQASVNDSVVHLSDLFDDIEATNDAVLGAAPAPGKTMIINARTLTRVANLYDVDWVSHSAADQVVVIRTAQTVSQDQILDALKQSLSAKGVAGDFEVTLGGAIPSITLSGDLPPTVEVAQMSYTPGRDVFTAVIAAPSADNPVKTLSLSGVIDKVQNVPVLRSSLKAGDIISAADIDWVPVNVRNTVYDTIVDADAMIGKTPARSVEAGAPMRERDLISPQLVKRGDEILIQFNSGSMTLTAKGKAMQNGAEGDLIRVVNLSSNQSLRGVVKGDKLVSVQ
ncbi:MAG TPA: flagellar basal body P-ring formation chaperone FlgA [Alphaproteobacteria bacterium]|nr:flagellar basal body P-ring formation chaperone FlgA [Alphaproteobacteria bacterium]HNS44083.1 flagellar basal body P-ring formation chaperone FlgA [Alphaproteobacteria bacterium]